LLVNVCARTQAIWKIAPELLKALALFVQLHLKIKIEMD
jgi:hypothetical protein